MDAHARHPHAPTTMPAILLILGVLSAIAGTSAYFLSGASSSSSGPEAVGMMPDGSLLSPEGAIWPRAVCARIDLRRLPEAEQDGATVEDLTSRAATALRRRLGRGSKVWIEERGAGRTPWIHAWTIRDHGAFTEEQFRSRVLRSGTLVMLPLALDEDFEAAGTDERREQAKVEAWMNAADDRAGELWAFNGLHPSGGGPAAGLRWAWSTPNPDQDRRPLALAVPDDPKLIATGAWFKTVRRSSDHFGRPAIGLDTVPEREDDLEAATSAFVGRRVALVVGEDILIAPTINNGLRGGMIIEGGGEGFTQAEVDELVAIMNHPMEGLPLVEVVQ